jgi:DNA polymerase I-like protein with 3'-5' exonuclease and polymerase domains
MIKIDGQNNTLFQQAIAFLQKCTILAIDTETTGFDPFTSKILIITLGNSNQQYVFDIAKLTDTHIAELKKLLEDPKKLKLVQNGKFDYKMLKHILNITINNIYDTMIVEQVLTRGRKNAPSGLDDIVERHLGIIISKAVRKTFTTTKFGDKLSDAQIEYAAQDIMYLEAIREKQLILVARDQLEKVIDLENKAVLPTGDIELNGIYIDKTKWEKLADTALAERTAAELALDAYFIPIVGIDLLGHADINYNSPQQLSKALSIITKTPITTTKEEKLSTINHPAIEALLTYREKQKQYTTYGLSFLSYINPVTNRIHPDFLQVMGTDSGRYSCQNPNLQNLPARPEYRAPFCAPSPEYRIVGADYSGMELRILAELSEDPALTDIFDRDLDPHATVGSILYNKTIRAPGTNGPEDPGENMNLRRNAKTLNFG